MQLLDVGADAEVVELQEGGEDGESYFFQVTELQPGPEGVVALGAYAGSKSGSMKAVFEGLEKEGITPTWHFCKSRRCNVAEDGEVRLHVEKWRVWRGEYRPDCFEPAVLRSAKVAAPLTVSVTELRRKLLKKRGAVVADAVPVEAEVAMPAAKPRFGSAILQKIADRSSEGAKRKEKEKEKRKKKKKKKKKKKSSSSSSSSSSAPAEEDFSKPRTGGGAGLREVSRSCPGLLHKRALGKMKEYLTSMQGPGSQGDETAPIIKAYLSSVLFPSAGTRMTPRFKQELSSWGEAWDAILAGDVLRALDIIATRFQAVETAAQSDGDWQLAQHMQLIRDGRVSSVDDQLLELAATSERKETKLALAVSEARPH